jgi:Tfp pilus assembly protein PilP
MHRPRNSLIVALLFCSVFLAPVTGRAEQKAEEKAAPKAPLSSTIGDFTYTSQDRRDPFEQVHLLKMAKKNLGMGIQKSGYELEELKLVGIIKSGAVTFAVMEDTQGKGMMFKKGDFINSNLWLLDFLEDKVVFGFKLRGDVRRIAVDLPRK